MNARRVAFLSDSFHEVNGVALTSRQFEAFARRRQLPFLSVHAGPAQRIQHDGEVTVYELQRSNAAWNLEATSDLAFDPLIWRYGKDLIAAANLFQPDVIHITGPGDMGMLGAWLAHKLKIPLAASWHTNVHEYAGRRLEKLLSFFPDKQIRAVSAAAERTAFNGAARFYRMARVLFAPNNELVELLRTQTGKPCFIMQRGVDAELYNPSRRSVEARPFTIGYVGRLSVEKNVRFLAELERSLIAQGIEDYEFVVAGSGGEQEWLAANLKRARLVGVIKGEALASLYANMDVFAFPSQTDTFGNVILEALASGVPAVVTTGGGPKFLIRSGETGFVAADDQAFNRCILDLYHDRNLLASMRESARSYACSISWDRVFERVYEAYDQVLFPTNSVRVAS
ncbi:MAG TPA: glycosyltransferase [Bryobacteraceae bacterium]|nr:glycosyltransferase [Bryobacteraceae bacterium]